MKIDATLIGIIVFSILCAVVAVQIFYYLFIFSKLAFSKEPQAVSTQEYPVSVIICARDEAENLVKHLPGVLVQNYRSSHDVMVVNDNSTDETKYIIEEFQKTFKNLINLPLTQEALLIPGKKFPLSMGIKAAKYEILLLTDADCMPASENWIQKMQAGYYKPEIDIVLGYGAYRKMPTLLNKLIRFETFHTALQYLSFALAKMPYMGVGRNLSYKRQMFIKSKGFASINHIPSGDDDLFINKIATKNNTAIIIDKEAHTISDAKQTWGEWFKQKKRHLTTAKFYKPKFKLLLGLYSFSAFWVYPSLILSIIFYNWWLALAVYGVRLLLLAFVWKKSMNKLNEGDLWPMFLFFDLWQFIYYLIFAPALLLKPGKSWK